MSRTHEILCSVRILCIICASTTLQHNGPTTHQCINIAYTVRRALVRLGAAAAREENQSLHKEYVITTMIPNSMYFFSNFSLVCTHTRTHTLFDEWLRPSAFPTSFPTRHIMLVRREKLSPSYYFSCFCLQCRRRRSAKPRDGRLVFRIRLTRVFRLFSRVLSTRRALRTSFEPMSHPQKQLNVLVSFICLNRIVYCSK